MKKVTRREFLAAGGGAALGLALGGRAEGQGREDVRVGVIYPLSGPVASIGQTCKKGVELAADEINEAGGIKALGGARLRLVWGDSQSKPDVGVSEAQRLLGREKVQALVGSYQSDVTLAIARVTEQVGIPYISAIAVADKLTEQGYKWVFRINVKGTWIGRDFVKAAMDLLGEAQIPVKTVAILYVNNDYGQSTAKGFREVLKSLAPQWNLAADMSYGYQAPNVDTEVARVKAANPDVLFNVGYSADEILVARVMEKLRFVPKAYFLSGGASEPAYVRDLGKKAKGFFESGSWNPQLVKAGVSQKYKARFHEDLSYYSAFTYSALHVVAQALEAAKSTQPAALQKALRETAFDGPWNGTPARPIKFDEAGQNVNATRIASQFTEIDGAVRGIPVWPKAVAERKAQLPLEDFDSKQK